MKNRFHLRKTYWIAAALALVLAGPSGAVTSKIIRQTTDKELREGKSNGVVVMSPGTIQLGRAAKVLADEFEGVWSVNSVVVNSGTAYIGTSPNGGVYQYRLGTLTKLYSADTNTPAPARKETAVRTESSKDKDAEDENVVSDKEPFVNEHIFAMAVDVSGRLLVGFSGKRCRLARYENGRMETVFEPNDATYIFAIERAADGNIYFATGPKGKIYALDPSGKVVLPIYEVKDKNILTLKTGADGFLYAGVDGRGLVYKIDLRAKTATVLYDSEQPEITGLAFRSGAAADANNLYVAATAARAVQAEREFAATQQQQGQPPAATSGAGRPEPKEKSEGAASSGDGDGGLKLQIPNSRKEPEGKPSARMRPPAPTPRAPTASRLYKVTREGYVTEVFSESAFFLSLASQDGLVLAGTGNDGQLFAVDPDTEHATVLYKDEKAAQITAVTVAGKDIYVGTGNPARLIQLSSDYAAEGTYTSDLLDAGQPASWGKLQIDADIPKGCKVLVSSRSGNVKDVNDPSFSPWTAPVEITQPVPLTCPLGRFCQYRLTLRTQEPTRTPSIREIAVASTMPNLAPKVESVDVTRLSAANKDGFFKIAVKAGDENEDKLIYRIDFRRQGRERWIELKDKVEEESFEWNGKTVEDGRYEFRVTASDERSNSPTTKLTGSRISDPVIVDNTGPAIRKWTLRKEPDTNPKRFRLTLEAADELSIIGKLEYTVDSNAEWKSMMPDDGAFDTTDENFTIVTDELKGGDHVIAVRITDDAGNVTYKTFEFNL